MLVTLKSFNALKQECEQLKAENAKLTPEAVNAAYQASIQSLTKERDDALKVAGELHDQVQALTADRETYKAESATARAALTDLQSKFDDLTAKAAKLATDAVTVESRAKVIALEMTQAQGVPPVAATPSEQTTATLSLWEQFQAISDPAKRASFWRENKNAILAEQRKTAKG